MYRRKDLPGECNGETIANLIGEFFSFLLIAGVVLAVVLLNLGGFAALFTGHLGAAIPLLIFGLPGFVCLLQSFWSTGEAEPPLPAKHHCE